MQLRDLIGQSCIQIHMDLPLMVRVEERIMHRFVELFARFLGPMHYSSFALRMNAARWKLLRDQFSKLDALISSFLLMDHAFSMTNR